MSASLNSSSCSGALLQVEHLDAFYGQVQALYDMNISVDSGQIVALLGSNGAGKSTTLKTLSGLIRKTRGTVKFMGKDILRLEPHQIVDRGIVHVPEGRRVFKDLTIRENLELGSFTQRKNPEYVKSTMAHVLEIFPRLAERQKQKAGTLSGGEQQMLAIGRAMMSRPKLLMLDEPSMGLAPIIVKEIMKIIKHINEEGTPVLLVEQNVKMALQLANYAYILETGSVTMRGTAADLKEDPNVVNAYLMHK